MQTHRHTYAIVHVYTLLLETRYSQYAVNVRVQLNKSSKVQLKNNFTTNDGTNNNSKANTIKWKRQTLPYVQPTK